MRPSYADIAPGTPVAALLAMGYDTVEEKLDGMWVTVRFSEHGMHLYTRHGDLKTTIPVQWSADQLDELEPTVLHGEWLWGTTRSAGAQNHGDIVIFDCSANPLGDLTANTYRERRAMVDTAIETIDRDTVTSTDCYHVSTVPQAWEWVRGGHAEGLVVKNSLAAWGEGIGRIKPSVEMDYVCMGINWSDCHVKSVQGGLWIDGVLTRVCDVAGMSDLDRESIRLNADAYVGSVFRARGREIGKNGCLRHPQFAGWHADKKADDCVL